MNKRAKADTMIEPVSGRRRVIMAAAKLFLKKGFHKTTMREIARESGIVVGTLYHYINTKDDIMTLIMNEELAAVHEFIRDSEKSLVKMGPVKTLRLTIERYLHMIDVSQDLQVFWYHESGNMLPDQRLRLLEVEDKLAAMYSKILQAGCRSGDFQVKDVLLTAHDIIVLGDMWAFRRWFTGRHCTLDEFIRHQTDLILSGISTKSPAGRAVPIKQPGKVQKRGGAARKDR
ncbi:MAG: TetR/AcrR family transcriptional regulator [Dehalococcoidia bacterium]